MKSKVSLCYFLENRLEMMVCVSSIRPIRACQPERSML